MILSGLWDQQCEVELCCALCRHLARLRIFQHGLAVSNDPEPHRAFPILRQVVDDRNWEHLIGANLVRRFVNIDHDPDRGEGVPNVGIEVGIPRQFLEVGPVVAGLPVATGIAQPAKFHDPREFATMPPEFRFSCQQFGVCAEQLGVILTGAHGPIEFAGQGRRAAVAIEPQPTVLVENDGIFFFISLGSLWHPSEVADAKERILVVVFVGLKRVTGSVGRLPAVVPRPVGEVQDANLAGRLSRDGCWGFVIGIPDHNAGVVPAFLQPLGVLQDQTIGGKFVTSWKHCPDGVLILDEKAHFVGKFVPLFGRLADGKAKRIPVHILVGGVEFSNPSFIPGFSAALRILEESKERDVCAPHEVGFAIEVGVTGFTIQEK